MLVCCMVLVVVRCLVCLVGGDCLLVFADSRVLQVVALASCGMLLFVVCSCHALLLLVDRFSSLFVGAACCCYHLQVVVACGVVCSLVTCCFLYAVAP